MKLLTILLILWLWWCMIMWMIEISVKQWESTTRGTCKKHSDATKWREFYFNLHFLSFFPFRSLLSIVGWGNWNSWMSCQSLSALKQLPPKVWVQSTLGRDGLLCLMKNKKKQSLVLLCHMEFIPAHYLRSSWLFNFVWTYFENCLFAYFCVRLVKFQHTYKDNIWSCKKTIGSWHLRIKAEI